MDETVQRPIVRRETPSVFGSFDPLKREGVNYHVRVLRYSKTPPLCDIREFHASDDFTGYTKKGIALTKEQLAQLLKDGPAILEMMEKNS